MNAVNEVTSHRSEILFRSEIQTGLSSLRVSCKRALKRNKGNINVSPLETLVNLVLEEP